MGQQGLKHVGFCVFQHYCNSNRVYILKHYCNSNKVCAFAGHILTIPTVFVTWEKILLDTYLQSFKLCIRM